jgi:predicted transcriptional regulator
MPKHDTLRIRCDAQLKADLEVLARRENRSMSNLALHILTQYTAAHETASLLRETPAPNAIQQSVKTKRRAA